MSVWLSECYNHINVGYPQRLYLMYLTFLIVLMLLQVRSDGVALAPPSPLNEDSDSSRGSTSAGAPAEASEDRGQQLPASERMLLCTQVDVEICSSLASCHVLT